MSGDLGGQVRQGLLWSVIRHWGNRVGGMAVFFVMARLLQPAEFGLFASAMVVVAFLEILAEQGINQALVQRQQLDDREVNAVFWVNLAVAAAMTAITILLAPAIADWMSMPGLDPLIQASSAIILVNSSGLCHYALMRRSFAYQALAMRALAGLLAGGAAGIAAALAGAGAWSLVIQLLVSSLVQAAMLWRDPRFRPTLPPRLALARPLLGYGMHVQAARIVDFLAQRGQELAVASLLGPVAMGIFSIGSRTAAILTQALSSAVQDVAHAGLSRIAHDRERLLEASRASLVYVAALLVPILLGVAVSATELCVLVFGQRWADSGEILRPLAIAAALHCILSNYGALLSAAGRPGLNLATTILRAAATAAAVVLARDAGLAGMTWAVLLAQVIVAPVVLVTAAVAMGASLRRDAAAALPAIAAAAIAFAAAVLLPPLLLPADPHPALSLGARSALFAATTLLLARLLGGWAPYGDILGRIRSAVQRRLRPRSGR